MGARLAISGEIAVLRIRLSEVGTNDFEELFPDEPPRPSAPGQPPRTALTPGELRDLRRRVEDRLEYQARERLGDVKVTVEFHRGSLEVVAVIRAATDLALELKALLKGLYEMKIEAPSRVREDVEATLDRPVQLRGRELELRSGLLQAEEQAESVGASDRLTARQLRAALLWALALVAVVLALALGGFYLLG